jgi:hypothetical protein
MKKGEHFHSPYGERQGRWNTFCLLSGKADMDHRLASTCSVANDPNRTLGKNLFCDAQCYFFRIGLAFWRWPRSSHADAFEEEAHGCLDALLHDLSRARVA